MAVGSFWNWMKRKKSTRTKIGHFFGCNNYTFQRCEGEKTTVNIVYVMLEREEERNPSKHIQHSTTTAGRCGPNFVFIKIIFSELNWIELTKDKFNKPNLLNCGSCVCTSSSSTYRYNVSFLYWWHATLLLIMLMMVIGKNSICCRVLFFSSSSL